MLSFFDNIYYQLYTILTSENESKKRDWASSILTLLQALNALTIYIFIAHVIGIKEVSKAIVALITVLTIVFNYLRYQYLEKRSPSILNEEWSEISVQKQVNRKATLSIYIIATLALCIVSMIIFKN